MADLYVGRRTTTDSHHCQQGHPSPLLGQWWVGSSGEESGRGGASSGGIGHLCDLRGPLYEKEGPGEHIARAPLQSWEGSQQERDSEVSGSLA